MAAVRRLRLAPNKREFTAPIWLAFDPEYGKSCHPTCLWGQPNLAASEVLSALIQFPEWQRAWFNGASAPNLTGYQLTGLSFVLRLSLGYRRLLLDVWDGGRATDNRSLPETWRSSPSVRVLG
jgi:hypothetical protein